ncbi:GntR family transcriptional regulator [Priestia megaterium]|nr:GntR family transcriptional regulator [Priestia megaterium]
MILYRKRRSCIMKLDHSKGAAPLYYQLKEIIQDKIVSGEFEVGSIIPSELELQKQYSLSRITVRQALNELVQEGYLNRQRGKGTIVLGEKLMNEQLVTIKSFTDEMNERGLTPGTLSVAIVLQKANQEVAKQLKISLGEEVYKITRVRTGDGVPIVVFKTYLPKTVCKDGNLFETTDSLYESLRERGIVIKKTLDKYEAIIASTEISRLLEIDTGSPLLKRSRVSISNAGKVVEFTKAYYNASLYSYNIELQDKD